MAPLSHLDSSQRTQLKSAMLPCNTSSVMPLRMCRDLGGVMLSVKRMNMLLSSAEARSLQSGRKGSRCRMMPNECGAIVALCRGPTELVGGILIDNHAARRAEPCRDHGSRKSGRTARQAVFTLSYATVTPGPAPSVPCGKTRYAHQSLRLTMIYRNDRYAQGF